MLTTTPTKTPGPRNCTTQELAKVGVVLIDRDEIRLGCCCCGREWSPNLRQDGRLFRGYWQCFEGCNRQS